MRSTRLPRPMRRIAVLSALAVPLAGLPLLEEAAAGDRCCRHSRGVHYYAPPPNPWAAWRAYYGAQAEVSRARRAARANYYRGAGRHVPSRYFGPPTNTYAESYAQNPYSYFSCPLARRGEGVCSEPDFFPQ